MSEKLTKEGRKFYLSRSHYLILMQIANEDEHHFYEIESYRNGWNKNELGRQNPTIGIIICKDKKDAVIEMTLPENNSFSIF